MRQRLLAPEVVGAGDKKIEVPCLPLEILPPSAITDGMNEELDETMKLSLRPGLYAAFAALVGDAQVREVEREVMLLRWSKYPWAWSLDEQQ